MARETSPHPNNTTGQRRAVWLRARWRTSPPWAFRPRWWSTEGSSASPGCRRLIGQPGCDGCDQRWRGLCGVIPSELRGWVETRAATERSAAQRRVAAPRPASHANACALPGPRHSFARGGEDTSRSGSVLRAYCILDAELSDVIVFAAPRSTPARARPRATPFAQQHLKFHGPQIRVGA